MILVLMFLLVFMVVDYLKWDMVFNVQLKESFEKMEIVNEVDTKLKTMDVFLSDKFNTYLLYTKIDFIEDIYLINYLKGEVLSWVKIVEVSCFLECSNDCITYYFSQHKGNMLWDYKKFYPSTVLNKYLILKTCEPYKVKEIHEFKITDEGYCVLLE